MAKYTVYHGEFICQECKAKVGSIRLYPDLKEFTWMCPDKHVSKVKISPKKKDYERKERE